MPTTVVMLETHPGSENGYDVKFYVKGRRYKIGDFLLEAFILQGCVRVIDENNDGFLEPIEYSPSPVVIDNKAIGEQKRGRGRPRKSW